MKWLGFIFIAGSFLGSSLVAVEDEEIVDWDYLFAALAVGIAGIVLVRVAARLESRSAATVGTNIQNIRDSLERIVENLTRLNGDRDQVDVYDLRQRIDEGFHDDLVTFVEARQTIGHAYGLQAYANVMSHFATGERHLSRVWSCSADGYVDEAHAYLTTSLREFAAAQEKLAELRSTRVEGGDDTA